MLEEHLIVGRSAWSHWTGDTKEPLRLVEAVYGLFSVHESDLYLTIEFLLCDRMLLADSGLSTRPV